MKQLATLFRVGLMGPGHIAKLAASVIPSSFWATRMTSDTNTTEAQTGLGATATGRALFTAANQSAARTAIGATSGGIKKPANGIYGFDRWKGHANGIEQIIEALPAGEYTLTWSGGGSGTFGGTTAVSPIKATVTAGNRSVVVPATATNVSVVQGNAASDPFVARHLGQETILCQRYFQICGMLAGAYYNTTVATIGVILPVMMRATPTVIANSGGQVLEPGVANRAIVNVSATLSTGQGGQIDVTTAAITNVKPACFVKEGALSFDAEL